MAARAMWRGVVTLGPISVPVKLHAAVKERRVSFNLLHDQDKARLRQRFYCSAEGVPVEREETVKGYEVDDNRYVIVGQEELAALEPESDRVIDTSRFVETSLVDPRYYERPYYLSPDGQPRMYAALAAALSASGRIGICTWVMRNRAYLGALGVSGQTLHLMTLRYADEVIAAETLGLPDAALSDKELKTAHYLIEQLAEKWDAAQYHDEYTERLRDFLDRKGRGEVITFAKPPEPQATEPANLLSLLQASVEEAKKRKRYAASA